MADFSSNPFHKAARIMLKYQRAATTKLNREKLVTSPFIPTGASVEVDEELDGAWVEVRGKVWVTKREMAEVKLDDER